jgi:hypothetical protein
MFIRRRVPEKVMGLILREVWDSRGGGMTYHVFAGDEVKRFIGDIIPRPLKGLNKE